jgi:hypothetical protein
MTNDGFTLRTFSPYLAHGQELIDGVPVKTIPVALRRLRRLQAHLQSQLLDERDRMARQLPLLIPEGSEPDAEVRTILVPHLLSVRWAELEYVRDPPHFVLEIVPDHAFEDRIPLRLSIYQRIGVLELWIIYEERRILERRILLEGVYMDPHIFEYGEPVGSIVFPGVQIDWAEADLV